MPDDRDLQRYFEVLQRFCSPAELEAFCKQVGSAEDLREAIQEIEACLQERRFRRHLWRFVGWACITATGTLTFLGAIRGLLPTGWGW